jgi:capsid protein
MAARDRCGYRHSKAKDGHGNPVEYHVLKDHPGATLAGFSRDFDRVSAEAVIHFFRADRPGQSRGIPEITPALPLFAQLPRYTLAVIAAAKAAADFAAVLYTDGPVTRPLPLNLQGTSP